MAHKSKIKSALKASGIKKFLLLDAKKENLSIERELYSFRDSRLPNLIDSYQLETSYKGVVSIEILTPEMPSNIEGLTYITFTEEVGISINAKKIFLKSPKKAFTSFPNSFVLPDVNIDPLLKSLGPEAIGALNRTHAFRGGLPTKDLRAPLISLLVYNKVTNSIYVSNRIPESDLKSRARSLKVKSFCAKLFSPFL